MFRSSYANKKEDFAMFLTFRPERSVSHTHNDSYPTSSGIGSAVILHRPPGMLRYSPPSDEVLNEGQKSEKWPVELHTSWPEWDAGICAIFESQNWIKNGLLGGRFGCLPSWWWWWWWWNSPTISMWSLTSSPSQLPCRNVDWQIAKHSSWNAPKPSMKRTSKGLL